MEDFDIKEIFTYFMMFLCILFVLIVMKGKTFKCVFINFPMIKECRDQ